MKKRIICLCLAIAILIASISARLGYIMLSGSYVVEAGFNSYSLSIDNLDYQLYYRNGEKFNNNIETYVAVIRPNEKCIGELYKFFSYNETKDIIERLSKGYPITIELDKKIESKYIQVFKTYKSSYPCKQLINKTSSGIMNYLDTSKNGRKISFSVDAKGRLLSGDNGTITDYSNSDSLILTIDKDIQSIADKACSNMKNGCCVIMDVETGELLACVTKPDDSFINKIIQNYAVGSVFKLIVSACALENNINPIYNCTGSIEIGDSVFSCQNNNKHSYQTLKMALANSCNCYFVNLALKLGSEKLIKTSKAFGFDNDIYLLPNWKIKGSSLPNENNLMSKGQLALLGFGQGMLLSTPLQIASSLCTIANDGKRINPSIIIDENKEEYAISSKNSKKLIEYMRYVVEYGTGRNAEDVNHLSAGKTATAQTGSYIDGIEQLNTWFAGIYPYNNPKYAIVVMTENGTSGSADCCPIYRTIVEMIK